MSGVKGQKWYHRYHQSYESKPTRSGKVGQEHFLYDYYKNSNEDLNQKTERLEKLKKKPFFKKLSKEYKQQLKDAMDEYTNSSDINSAITNLVFGYGYDAIEKGTFKGTSENSSLNPSLADFILNSQSVKISNKKINEAISNYKKEMNRR